MKILYKPFALVAAGVAARIGQSTFRALWSKVDDAQPPTATTHQAPLPKVLGAVALEAATMAAVAAVVDRASARVFEHLTGYWPGEETPEET